MEYEHIDWIIENRGEELMRAVQHEGIEIDPENILGLFVNADPSQKKNAVDWMVKTYISGGFLLEDLQGGLESKVCETIGWFAEHRRKLEQRNLSSYSTLAEVYTAIQPFLNIETKVELSGKALKRREKEEVFAESILLRKEENLLIAVPLTKKASQWWGKGTRWCTAATKQQNSIFGTDMFDHYNKDAPLVVIVFPKGLTGNPAELSEDWEEESRVRKFQLWVPLKDSTYEVVNFGNPIQFMDETDKAVSPEFVKQNWSAFEPVMKWAFEKNMKAILFFPEDAITKEMALALIKCNRDFIKSIPKNLIDGEIVDLIVSGSDHSLYGVPEKFLTPELCKLALKCSSKNIQFIPHHLQTLEMCAESIKSGSIQYLSPDLLNKEIIDQALNNWKLSMDKSKKETVYTKYLRNGDNPLYIFYECIPEKFKTRDMLERLSIIEPNIIQHYDINTITKEMATRVIENKPNAIKHIPEHLWSEEMIDSLLGKNPDGVVSLPKELVNKSIIVRALTAFQSDMTDFTWIPDQLVDPEIIEIILRKSDRGSLHYISGLPKEVWTQKIADKVFLLKPELLRFVPQKFVKKIPGVEKDQDYFQHLLTRGVIESRGLILGEPTRTGSTTMKTVQSIGRAFRAPRTLPNIPTVFLDEFHTRNEDDALLNALNFVNNKSRQVNRKWDESSLDGLKPVKQDKILKFG